MLLGNDTTTIKNSTIRSVISTSDIKTLEIEDTTFLQERVSGIDHIKSDLLHIKNSTLNTDFYESQIKQVVFENVQGRQAEFVNVVIDGMSISDSHLGNVVVYNDTKPLDFFESKNSSYTRHLAFGREINRISISDCPYETGIMFTEATVNEVLIDNCRFTEFSPAKSHFKRFEVTNSRISISYVLNGWWYNLTFDDLSLKNVVLDGEFEIENASAVNFKAENVKKGALFKAIYNNTNFQF
jgi:uncharacterized protein YjbI with pentapeptide repeats